MTILLLTAAFAAFCIWLTVRIVNRRERWAKWTAGVVVGVPVLYVLSFGPACWLNVRFPSLRVTLDEIYSPLIAASLAGPPNDWLFLYANLGRPRGTDIGFLREGPRCSTWIYAVNE